MTGSQDWIGRVGESWAAEWQRTDRSFQELTAQLQEHILRVSFDRVLDIGCGAGELSLLVASARPGASVHGIDLSPALLDAARERGAAFPNVTFELADASIWKPQEGAEPDLLMSRHGVMFFDEPVDAFSHLKGTAAPGATLVFSCFRDVRDNPFFGEVGSLVPSSSPPSDPTAPGPFAFSDKDRVASILSEAGWKNVDFERVDFAMVAGAGDDPVADAVSYFSRIGPGARMMAELPKEKRPAVREKIAELARRHLADGRVALGASAWIVSATAS